MWPDRVSNPGSLTYESGALPTALRGPAWLWERRYLKCLYHIWAWWSSWSCEKDHLEESLFFQPMEANTNQFHTCHSRNKVS